MNELELAWKNATSLRKGQSKGRYIGKIFKGVTEYLFYKDSEGQYRYESRRKSA